MSNKIATLLAFIACTSFFSASAEVSSVWQDVAIAGSTNSPMQTVSTKQTRSALNIEKQHNTLKRRALELNESALKVILDNSQTEIDLPLPKGGFVRLNVINTPLLSDELAKQYPDIKTWRVTGVDDPRITGRIDFTEKGFHGMLILADGDTVYIDPDKDESSNVYHSLSQFENATHFDSDFNCQEHSGHLSLLGGNESISNKNLVSSVNLKQKKLAKLPVQNLIIYRLALAGTAEYTATQGGTKSLAYASMVTTINRVNEVFQRDLGIKLQLVSGEQLIYTSPNVDPYTNNNLTTLVDENMSNLYNTFGLENYDIGHVFATGASGGLAYVGAACIGNVTFDDGTSVNGLKAGGASGFSNPQGETFSITLVAHELGHQLGATHTFNGTGGYCGDNQQVESAVEPGGGSTIMSYSGSCGSDSLQNYADDMFHWKSISQINSYTRVAPSQVEYPVNGNNCGARTSISGQNPTANAGGDATIPKNTPFLLAGTASNGDSYAWDQIDIGTPSAVDVDTGDNAIIRSLLPSEDSDRYIPRLLDLFTGSSTTGEILPQTARDVNFAFVVRDGNGGVATDYKKISTKDNGLSFSVLSHSSAETLSAGQSSVVTWNVAGTDLAPISCSKVDIQLLRSDGTKNPLLMDTDNDGVENIQVPNATPAMTNARIMVSCASQPFFQVSTGDISVSADAIAPVITLNGSNTVEVVRTLDYIDAGAIVTDNIDTNITVSISGEVNTAVIGQYILTYTAVDASGNSAIAVTRTVNVIADTVAPIIALTDSNNVNVYLNKSYVEAGATATDNVDQDLVVVVAGVVNTSLLGEYILTYTIADTAGNVAIPVTRTVNVIADTLPPIITVNGDEDVVIYLNQSYTDQGATATDNADGVAQITSADTVDVNTIGIYTISYEAIDSAGNVAIVVTRTVNVIADTVPPVISLNGDSNVDTLIGTTYVDAGATATDNADSSVIAVSTGTVDISTVGTYTITYTAMDSAGNTTLATRTVNVIADIEAPVITLIGSSTVTISKGEIYLEFGATALDNADGSVTVVTSGSVDSSTVGTYIITYTATDNAENSSTLDRTVNVVLENETSLKANTSGGGSMGFLLLPMALFGLRRRYVKNGIH